jgi:hypothetical protein
MFVGRRSIGHLEPVNPITGLENNFKMDLREMACQDRKCVEVAVNMKGRDAV